MDGLVWWTLHKRAKKKQIINMFLFSQEKYIDMVKLFVRRCFSKIYGRNVQRQRFITVRSFQTWESLPERIEVFPDSQ